MTTRHIVYAPLAALVPADANPKMHDIPSIIASLTRFGWTSPILLDERTGKMAAGHGRREAAISMKANGDPMPGGVFVDDDGDWLVPLERGWHSRDDTEAKAYVMADNQLTIAGGWHNKTLAQLLEDVITDDAPLMETIGFTADDIDGILHRIDPETLSSHEQVADDPWSPDKKSAGDDELDAEGAKPAKTRTHTCPACGFDFPDA